MRVTLRVNGLSETVEAEPETPILYLLRNDLGLSGPKFGCGIGQCGACTVLVDGAARRSCALPLESVAGREITTLEGLGTEAAPHPLQRSFLAEQAGQCGYCLSGMIMTAKALLDEVPDPSDAELRAGLAGNLCRCGSHNRILRAIRRAAAELRG